MLLQHAGTRIDEQHMLWEKNTRNDIKILMPRDPTQLKSLNSKEYGPCWITSFLTGQEGHRQKYGLVESGRSWEHCHTKPQFKTMVGRITLQSTSSKRVIQNVRLKQHADVEEKLAGHRLVSESPSTECAHFVR